MTTSLIIHADLTPGPHRLPDDFWLFLPILGPGSLVAQMYMTDQLRDRTWTELPLDDFACRLGHSNAIGRLMKSLRRLHDFRYIRFESANVAVVRMELPRVTPGSAARLPHDIIPQYAT